MIYRPIIFWFIINQCFVASQKDSLRHVKLNRTNNADAGDIQTVKGLNGREKQLTRQSRQAHEAGNSKHSKKSKSPKITKSPKKKSKTKGGGDGNSFDLSECGTYALTWVLDLEQSCDQPMDENYTGCICEDAQRRIENEEIKCGYDMCPDNCEVCKVCLYYVEEDCFKSGKGKKKGKSGKGKKKGKSGKGKKKAKVSPTFTLTSSPIPAPSPPTPLPKAAPSVATGLVDDQFDLRTCSSYSDVWNTELVSTCSGNAFNNDFTGCICGDAEKRIANGQIDCNSDEFDKPCPEDCTACELCLYYVVPNCTQTLVL